MRHTLLTAAVLSTLLINHSAQADWGPGAYMRQSLGATYDLAEWYLEHTEYGFGPEISLVGSHMTIGEQYPFVKTFHRNTDYVIVAAGDIDANDVDLRVRDDRGRVIAEDMETSREAVVEFNAGRGGRFTIEMELFDADASAFVSFIVLQEGGWYMPRYDFEIATDEMHEICEDGHDAARLQGKSLLFNAEHEQASLFGGLMGGDEGTTLINLKLGTGEVLIVAAGDSDVEDIDLVLYDQHGYELAADRLIDAYPVLNFHTRQDRQYKVELTSAAQYGTIPTFCVVGLLQVR